MQVRMTSEMLEAVRQTSEIPDNLLACVNQATADRDGFLVTLSRDEAMAMAEMCQWYIRRDPVTGHMDAKATLFDAIVKAINQVEDQ